MIFCRKTTINLAKKSLICSSLRFDVTKKLLISGAISHKVVIISIVNELAMMKLHPTRRVVN